VAQEAEDCSTQLSGNVIWRKSMMKICSAAWLVLAGFFAFALIVTPTVVSARDKDRPNYGFCKSGKKVTDIKNCKENGGNK
jgi:hypothetical protein